MSVLCESPPRVALADARVQSKKYKNYHCERKEFYFRLHSLPTEITKRNHCRAEQSLNWLSRSGVGGRDAKKLVRALKFAITSELAGKGTSRRICLLCAPPDSRPPFSKEWFPGEPLEGRKTTSGRRNRFPPTGGINQLSHKVSRV